MIGAICGLGYDPETSKPLFKENDIEITFDTVIDNEFLNEVNKLSPICKQLYNNLKSI